MKSIRFIKGPGYIYDLYFIFTLYFNKKHVENKFVNPVKSAADIQFYEKSLEEFLPISDDLLLFFRLNKDGKPFMTKYYFDPYIDRFMDGSGDLALVQEELLDYDRVIDSILAFYFGDQPEDVRAQCKASMAVANKLICASDYDAPVKAALYAFLIDPYSVIRRLAHELMTKEFRLSKQYERNADKFNALQNGLDVDKLAADIDNNGRLPINADGINIVNVSWCWNYKNYVGVFFHQDASLVMLGSDYEYMLQSMASLNTAPDLHAFGMVLSEANRVAILEMLLEKHEITLKDVEQALSIASTNAYYHVSFMLKNGLLKTRNMGRTVVYSLDRTYFDHLIGVLRPYSEDVDTDKEENEK